MNDDTVRRDQDATAPLGRPVRVVSLNFRIGSLSLDRVTDLIDREGNCDLIALPETWTGPEPEHIDGRTITALRDRARAHRTYIVCPIYRWEDRQRRNSAILIDRDGGIACVYDKVFPYWSEFDLTPPARPGRDVPVHQADFGRVGMAICFDVNFPAVWQALADGQAELVIWPSAYSAGSSLQAHALNHHFAIVSATSTGDCQVYDITGERLRDECRPPVNVTRITLDLDRGIYHENFNTEGRDRLLRERADDVVLDRSLPREEWFVLKARRPGVSARTLARAYGLEELRDYTTRSRREINLLRGEGSGSAACGFP